VATCFPTLPVAGYGKQIIMLSLITDTHLKLPYLRKGITGHYCVTLISLLFFNYIIKIKLRL